ncbi:hypothetical protein B1R96_04110 [Priestia aryabhattai]|nr:hypothetical protein B1R96_04110 [Priestia aryabhattai]
MLNYLGIHIGSLYFPTSILLITFLVLIGFFIYFFSRKRKNRHESRDLNKKREARLHAFSLFTGFFLQRRFFNGTRKPVNIKFLSYF